MVRDPVDDSPLVGARIRVGSRVTHTGEDGSFEVRVGRRRTGNLRTRFEMPGYVTYRSWTVAGTDTTRTIYLFPDHPVDLDEHEEPISAELFRDQFDIVYRDPEWRDPRREHGWLWRWQQQPRIVVDSRVTVAVEDEDGWRLVATRKVPGKVRRHVRRVIRDSIGPLTGGRFEAGKIRFRRQEPGEVVVKGLRELYRPGEIHVSFTDAGFYSSGGGHIVEAHRILEVNGRESRLLDLDSCRVSQSLSDCLTIVSGAPRLDVDSLRREIRRGNDYLVKHEFAHVLGMQHRMGTDVSPTHLCSIMGGHCDDKDETIGAVTHVDRVLARLAYSRPPGNDRQDQDPEPGSPSPRD